MAAQAGDAVEIVTNQTPFYGESGGQAGDTGHIHSAKAKGQVTDTQKWLGALHVHSVRVTEGSFLPGDAVDLKVDAERRRATRANHSATHLLHAALKRVLGNHVSQKGSLVTAERLRFDFSHPKPVTPQELEQIEAQVNAVVRQNSDTTTRLMATDQAISAGAEALFGEKYGDEVRVLSMGKEMGGADLDAEKAYSVELCGGTHVHRLGDIGLFTILSESAVAAGVRRIEALTSEHARRYLTGQAEIAREAASAIKTPIGELAGRVAQLSEERRKLERELAEAKKQLALAGPAKNGEDSETIAGLKAVLRLVEGVSPKDLKSLADGAKSQVGSGVVAFVAAADGKASIVAGVTEDLTARISAVDLVKVAAEALGGKGGGGRPDMAQAGGPDNGNPSVALDAIRKKLGELAPA
jgi:alanyl-tRNA synthetase